MNVKECKSYADVAKLLGYSYYNGSVKKIVFKYCKEQNLNIDEIIENNKKKPNICLFCGKEIEGKNKFLKKFCNSSCAAKYNNKGRVCSDETKQKTSQVLKEKYKSDILKPHNLGKIVSTVHIKKSKTDKISNIVKLSDLIKNGLVLNPHNITYEDGHISPHMYKERMCIICGKNFRPSLTKSGRISVSNTCSSECHKKLVSYKSSESMKKIINDGRHQGWKTRNIISYLEKFWMGVLESNGIQYIKELYVFNKYFLDFHIEKNGVKIDLEIDGKQHLYEDRKKHDEERDKFLTENGYVVYRIPWNEINSEYGKSLMKTKIDDFLNFINQIN